MQLRLSGILPQYVRQLASGRGKMAHFRTSRISAFTPNLTIRNQSNLTLPVDKWTLYTQHVKVWFQLLQILRKTKILLSIANLPHLPLHTYSGVLVGSTRVYAVDLVLKILLERRPSSNLPITRVYGVIVCIRQHESMTCLLMTVSV